MPPKLPGLMLCGALLGACHSGVVPVGPEAEVRAPPLDLASVIRERSRSSPHPFIRNSAAPDGSILAPTQTLDGTPIPDEIAGLLPLIDRAGFPAAGSLKRVGLPAPEADQARRSPIQRHAEQRRWLISRRPFVTLQDSGLTSLGDDRDSWHDVEPGTLITVDFALAERVVDAEQRLSEAGRERYYRVARELAPTDGELALYWLLQIREALARGDVDVARRAGAILAELGCLVRTTEGKSCSLEAEIRRALARTLWVEARQLLVRGGERTDALILLARAERIGASWAEPKVADEALALQSSIERQRYYRGLSNEVRARLDPSERLLDEIAASEGGQPHDHDTALSRDLHERLCVWDNIPLLLPHLEDDTPTRLLLPNSSRYSWQPLNIDDVVLHCLDTLAERSFRADYLASVRARGAEPGDAERDEQAELHAFVEAWWAGAASQTPVERALADLDSVEPYGIADAAARALEAEPELAWPVIRARFDTLEHHAVRHAVAIVLLGLDGAPRLDDRASKFARDVLGDRSLGARHAGTHYLWIHERDPSGLRVLEDLLRDGSAVRVQEPIARTQEFIVDDILALLWRSGDPRAQQSFQAAIRAADRHVMYGLSLAFEQGCFDHCELDRAQEELALRALADRLDGRDDAPYDVGNALRSLCQLDLVRQDEDSFSCDRMFRNRTLAERRVTALVNRGLEAIGESPRRRPELAPPASPAASVDEVVRVHVVVEGGHAGAGAREWARSWEGKTVTRLETLTRSFAALAERDRIHDFTLRVLRFEQRKGVALLVFVSPPRLDAPGAKPYWFAAANCDTEDACAQQYSHHNRESEDTAAQMAEIAGPMFDRWRRHPADEAVEEYELRISFAQREFYH